MRDQNSQITFSLHTKLRREEVPWSLTFHVRGSRKENFLRIKVSSYSLLIFIYIDRWSLCPSQTRLFTTLGEFVFFMVWFFLPHLRLGARHNVFSMSMPNYLPINGKPLFAKYAPLSLEFLILGLCLWAGPLPLRMLLSLLSGKLWPT